MDQALVQAPAHLGAASRAAFREEALAALSRLGVGPGSTLIVDLGVTQRLDSAGLGTLVMLQMRAAEKRCSVTLRGVSEEIRVLLLMTRLEDRFVVEPQVPPQA